MNGRLEFWYEFGSPYSYPAAMRIDRVAGTRGVAVVWRPFLLGPIFAQQRLGDSPFNLNPAKGRYMWRDLARICAAEGLPLKRPTAFPRTSLLAARVALVGDDQGWIASFSRAVFDAHFAHDAEIAAPAALAPLIADAGGDPDTVLALAGTDPIKARLRAQVDRAVQLDLFGAPSFLTADGELFWGNDRLEAAVAWAAEHAKEPA